jgi:hypothetical protein
VVGKSSQLPSSCSLPSAVARENLSLMKTPPDEDLILDLDAGADEGVALDLAVGADAHALLDLDQRADAGVGADLTAVRFVNSKTTTLSSRVTSSSKRYGASLIGP